MKSLCRLLLLLALSITALHAEDKKPYEDIGVKREKEGYVLGISTYVIDFKGPKGPDGTYTSSIRYDIKEKDQLFTAFNKVLEWEGRALELNAENFSQVVPGIKIKDQPVIFVWHLYYSPENFESYCQLEGALNISLRDIHIFMDLAKQLPAMEKELAMRIERAKVQGNMFK